LAVLLLLLLLVVVAVELELQQDDGMRWREQRGAAWGIKTTGERVASNRSGAEEKRGEVRWEGFLKRGLV
jgi:hypothetical protein